mgnify:CR=1 FL=1
MPSLGDSKIVDTLVESNQHFSVYKGFFETIEDTRSVQEIKLILYIAGSVSFRTNSFEYNTQWRNDVMKKLKMDKSILTRKIKSLLSKKILLNTKGNTYCLNPKIIFNGTAEARKNALREVYISRQLF